jgi:hypothetical protein
MDIAAGGRMTGERIMWRAWVDTRNFSLEAYGKTRAEALATLAEMWGDWINNTGATLSVEDLLGDTSVMQIQTGAAYMDGEVYSS